MTRPVKMFWSFLLGLLGMQAGSAFAAINGVLCNPAIKGESQLAVAPGCIDVLAWSWGLSTPYVVAGGSGTQGKPNFQDISFTKYIDSASASLIKFAAGGGPISGTVDYDEYQTCAAGCQATVPYLSIHLHGAVVTSLSSGGSSGDGRHTENISLAYSEISYCYRPTDSQGTLGTALCFAYSVVKGAPIGQF